MKITYMNIFVKGILLSFFDVISLIVVFKVWELEKLKIYPWVVGIVIFAMLMVNFMVLIKNNFIKKYGVVIYTSTMTFSIIYYILIMSLSWIFYKQISSIGYVLIFLILTLIFFIILYGSIVTGSNHQKHIEKQEREKESVLNLNMILMALNDNIRKIEDKVNNEKLYKDILKAYNDLVERAKASTPFSRVNKPIIIELEKQIVIKLNDINDELITLNKSNDHTESISFILDELKSIKTQIVNREKLIVQ